MSFLTAEWRKLVLANYALDPAVLRPYVPQKTELDTWNGTTYASIVGFMFLNTRIRGIRVPFHVNFEEANLRFYVRHKHKGEWRRGVVFVREIVPKPAITWVANTLYKEHYATMPMRHRWEERADDQVVEYGWFPSGDKAQQRLYVEADKTALPIAAGSEEEFITEHYWGYTQQGNKTFEYEVRHPRWVHYPVRHHELKIDFELLYGADFAHLKAAEPISVMLAEGSETSVENKRRL